MLSNRLLALTDLGAEWVLWILLLLSVVSVGVMIERAAFFASRRLRDADEIGRRLLAGDLDGAAGAVGGKPGLEAEVVRAAVANAAKGPQAVREVVAGTVERVRIQYELRLAFLGTLGNNAPFIGLFGTVLGIIRAFVDLSRNPAAAGAGTVMAGISEALVATAVGLFVALPAVVAYNLFQRGLRRSAQRATSLGHAAVAFLEAAPPPVERARPEPVERARPDRS
ncbi:MAG TPA: MotA/TolQ/ExbB proton channel family protein [Anaeromyxobacter sp.]|nr:MotA/TolQ/ExbB proton channel family protein [Anaeromyxobacter sp.]